MKDVADDDGQTRYAINEKLKNAGAFGFLAGTEMVGTELREVKDRFANMPDFEDVWKQASEATRNMSRDQRYAYFMDPEKGEPLWKLYFQPRT